MERPSATETQTGFGTGFIGCCIANEPWATIGSPVFPAFRWSAGAISNTEINKARVFVWVNATKWFCLTLDWAIGPLVWECGWSDAASE